MKKKVMIIITILFIILFSICIFKLGKVLRVKTQLANIDQFYKEKGQIDVIFLGTSTVFDTFFPMEIYNKYGVVSYNRAMPQQAIAMYYWLAKEAIFRYKPKLFVIDMRPFSLANNSTGLSLTHYINLRSSFLKLQALYEMYGKNMFNKLNYFSLFHNRWEGDINKYDFLTDSFVKGRNWEGGININGGELWLNGTTKIPIQKKSIESYVNLDCRNSNYIFDNQTILNFQRTVDIIKENGGDVIFINLPYASSLNFCNLTYAFITLANSRGWKYFDYHSMVNDINIDFSNDMRDNNHLNNFGGRKVTDHLIPYIMEKYGIKDRRNDPAFQSWHDDYPKYERAINKAEIVWESGIDVWLGYAKYPKHSLFISLKGSDISNIPPSYIARLKSFGLKELDKLNSGENYIALIDNNEAVFEKKDKGNVAYKGRMKKFVNLNILSSKDKASIIVSGKERSKNINGLNIVVYDKELREVVDSVGIDLNAPYGVKRDPNENIIDKLRITPIYNEITLKDMEFIFGGGVFKYNKLEDQLAFSFDDRFVSHNMQYNKLYDIGTNQMIVERDSATNEIRLYIGNRKDYGKYYILEENKPLKIDIEEVKASKEEYSSNFTAMKIYTLNRNKLMVDISKKYGWSANEGTHIWSIGRELTLPIHTPKNDINKLFFKLSAYLDKICPEQNIVISANGRELARARFDYSKNEQLVEIDIPKELFKDSFIELKIDLLNEVSTPANNGSGDSRTLGIALSDIYFK